jgi:ubiquitin-conjugating enzyme E2 S
MSSHENLSPQVLGRLMKELRKLSRTPPEGIKYIPNTDDNIGEIHAEIEGPSGTPYTGGAWRVKLVLSQDFPNSPPKGFFLTRIFHPNIAKNGDICVNTLKKDWKPEMGISHVLQVIRCLLIVPFPESSLNDEAGKMFMESYDEYASRATLMTRIHALKSGTGKNASSSSSTSSSPNNTTKPKNGHANMEVVEQAVAKKSKLNAISSGNKKKKSGKIKKKRNKDRL